MKCLLCHSKDIFQSDSHFRCGECGLIFKDPLHFPDKITEKKRYDLHQNGLNSENGHKDFLQNFLKPLFPFLEQGNTVLDYGSGPTPILSMLLKDIKEELLVSHYDPFYSNDLDLEKKFDVITCTEVIEHFHNPFKDFELIDQLLSKNGLLAIMTLFYKDEIDFKKWWYKNDLTHVVFYSQKTFHFIANKYNYKIIFNDNNSIIIFKKG